MPQASPELPGVEQLFEESPCGLLATAADGTILRVNRTFCGWVGFAACELVGHRKLQELFTVGARIFHQTHWLPMLQMQGSLSEVKFDVKGRDGKAIPMLLNVIRRTSPTGVDDQVSAVIAEERNKYERELLAARRRADSLVLLEQDRVVFAEQMIGIVSHDLRNPLSVVLLATRVLSMHGDALGPEKTARMLGNITRAAQRSQRLIEDLLDFTVARLGQGLSVSRRWIDLHQTTERAVEELAVAFPDKALSHRQTGDGSVYADADRLAQLLGNLVANAVAYGEVAGRVTVTSAVADDIATLSVHNTGAPMAPESLATIFEPMVRGRTAASPPSPHSVGLGLFIVRAIAQAHGGDVAVTSTATEGTEFVLTWPRRPDGERGAAPQAPSAGA